VGGALELPQPGRPLSDLEVRGGRHDGAFESPPPLQRRPAQRTLLCRGGKERPGSSTAGQGRGPGCGPAASVIGARLPNSDAVVHCHPLLHHRMQNSSSQILLSPSHALNLHRCFRSTRLLCAFSAEKYLTAVFLDRTMPPPLSSSLDYKLCSVNTMPNLYLHMLHCPRMECLLSNSVYQTSVPIMFHMLCIF
jgi:hypothetical protein